MSFKYQIPPPKQWSVPLPGSSVTVNVITLFHRWPPWQPPLSSPPLSLPPSFLPLQRSPFSIAHGCIRFPHVANDCWSKGIFCFNLTLSQGGTKGTSSLQLVSLRKLFRIASFLGRLAKAYNPELSAIVCHDLAIILCLSPFGALPPAN